MIVQNIIYPEISEEEKELFFRGNALTDKNGILHLQAGERIVFHHAEVLLTENYIQNHCEVPGSRLFISAKKANRSIRQG